MAGFFEIDNSNASNNKSSKIRFFYEQHKKKLLIGGGVFVVFIIALIIGLSVGGSSEIGTKPDLNIIPDDIGSFSDSAVANDYSVPLNQKFPYGTKKIRGVNLGGWLILDPLVTPKIFKDNDVIDEWGLCEKLGKYQCSKLLIEHYDKFITKDDIKKISHAGLNHVRIPIGYWMINKPDDSPFVYGSWPYLLRCIQWCREYGIRVMIDFHSYLGSQNGLAHSGKDGHAQILNDEMTDMDLKKKLYYQFKPTFDNITQYFGHEKWRNVVTMINIMNSPNFAQTNTIFHGLRHYERFLNRTIKDIGNNDQSKLPFFVIHDVFEVGTYNWNDRFSKERYHNLAIDRRNPLTNYTKYMFESDEFKLNLACDLWQKDTQNLNKDTSPLIINGEFNLATTDCAVNFHGINHGARYSGTYKDNRGKEINTKTPRECPPPLINSEGKLLIDDKKIDFLTKFTYLQINAYEIGAGWFFYNIKTQDNMNPEFDYLLGLEKGWIPKNPNIHVIKCQPPKTEPTKP